MVHHIVMWKFKPEVEDAKKPELKKAMAENLKSLVGKVPGLLTVDFVEAPLASSTHDMARRCGQQQFGFWCRRRKSG